MAGKRCGCVSPWVSLAHTVRRGSEDEEVNQIPSSRARVSCVVVDVVNARARALFCADVDRTIFP